MAKQETLLSVKNLKLYFPIKRGVIQRTVGHVHAVDDISFDIRRGETLGLVGESGCGKTTTGRTILQLYKPSAGSVYFDNKDLVALKPEEMRQTRRKLQMIFQDPYASLSPRMTVEEIIGEPLMVHNIARGSEIRERVKLLTKVGLNPAYVDRYPHEFSGGQRQHRRGAGYRAGLIVCGEPISALDVSIQAQISLLEDLQRDSNLTYLFYRPRSLHGAPHFRVMVMYLGEVELADRVDL